ncbi:SpoVR family protein [bacterium]|nr:SpoVR family protein [bacterium]
MQLINQHTKAIMEGCKERALDAGLSFQSETLEYIVTNRDLIELSPKIMIPTLYDYWVHDVEVLKEKGKYELYPGNPYETVINTRPAISFYNDNNPDWLNVMIFYHVLGHIDFFQNNHFFRNTWDMDFTGEALSDKRVIARLRSEHGRWVDYIIEFARSIDNLVGYYDELKTLDDGIEKSCSERLNYYFDVFLQLEKHTTISGYVNEVNRYNELKNELGEEGEPSFFAEIRRKHPEFDAKYKIYRNKSKDQSLDLVQHIMTHSVFLNQEENTWMKSIIEIVRKTSLFFQPQIRTKILNEGWASYWHEKLFLKDDRINGHEVDFARVHAGVTSMPRVGLNPYALGLRLFYEIEERADKGRFGLDFDRMTNIHSRKDYDIKAGAGIETLFKIRREYSDFLFINQYVDQDFLSRYNLFVAGKRLNNQRMTWEYYVKSRKAKDYRKMLFESLYHPPRILIDTYTADDNQLRLIHKFEGKPLVREYIASALLGIEFLWGDTVSLETNQAEIKTPLRATDASTGPTPPPDIKWRRIRYTMKDRKLSKTTLG